MRAPVDYAIADVHGRADLLLPLVVACVEDAAARGSDARFTFLGDVIDRGPRSRDCLDMVCEVMRKKEGSALLMGNHEQLASRVLTEDAPEDADVVRWFAQGGEATLASYHPDPETAFEAFRTLYPHHLDHMASARSSLVRKGFFLAHAGVNPDRPFGVQHDRDLLWVRDDFLDHVGYMEMPVIHGHSVVGDLPVVTENRISIDTGAYVSGRLTACVLDGGAPRFLQTDGSGRRVVSVEPVRLDRGLGTCLDAGEPLRLAA